MRTKLIYSSKEEHSGYGAGNGDTGFREHDVFICCDECKKKYRIDTSKGIRGWELIEI